MALSIGAGRRRAEPRGTRSGGLTRNAPLVPDAVGDYRDGARTDRGSVAAFCSERPAIVDGSILVFGCPAIAATVWLGLSRAEETLALAGTSVVPHVPPAVLNGPSTADLTRRIKALEDQVKELEAGRRARSIPQTAADDLASF